MTRLTTLDLPQLHRATVGFDRMFDEMNRAFENTKSTGYPPYNVVEINENEFKSVLQLYRKYKKKDSHSFIYIHEKTKCFINYDELIFDD